MSWIWKNRWLGFEWMDQETPEPLEGARILRALERINRWLGGVQATISCLEQFSERWIPSQTIHIVDWGTGGADLPRAIVRWARHRGRPVRIVGVDSSPWVVAYARQACEDYPEIEIVQADADHYHPPDGSFDYAISSLTLHHLTNDQIISLLRQSHRLARRGIIMNDLKRSVRAWGWIWAISRLTLMPIMVRHDGPLSVRRAFTKQELEYFAREAGLSYVKVRTHFGYRLTLSGEKNV